jgi:hypothetical protein
VPEPETSTERGSKAARCPPGWALTELFPVAF